MNSMTRRMWYILFPEPYRSQALQQQTEYLDEDCADIHEALVGEHAFTWKESKQGFDYWFDFYKKHKLFTRSDFISKYKKMNNNVEISYCSFNVSKLLKEIGMAVPTKKAFTGSGIEMGEEPYDEDYDTEDYYLQLENFIYRPPQDLAIEWIRLNFNYFVSTFGYGDNKWCCIIQDINTNSIKTQVEDFNTPQEAKESGLLNILTYIKKTTS